MSYAVSANDILVLNLSEKLYLTLKRCADSIIIQPFFSNGFDGNETVE